MEITLADNDLRLVFPDTLYQVCPLATQLESSLVCLSTGIHGKHLVIPKIVCYVFFIFTQNRIVECP